MKVLGYCWSHKLTTEVENNKFVVKFRQGVSDEYPEHLESMKDFCCHQVMVGDYSSLYMSVEDAIRAYNLGLREATEYDHYKEIWKKEYSHSMTWEDWSYCWAVNGVVCESSIRRQFIPKEFYNIVGMKDNNDKVKLVNKYNKISEKRYEDSLQDLKRDLGY